MLSKPLIAFAHNYNFTILEGHAYGIIGKYLVSVTNNGYKKVAFITYFPYNEDENGNKLSKYKLSEELNLKQLPALRDFEITEDGLLISTGEDLNSFDEAVNESCKVLDNLGYKGIEQCTYCGECIDYKDVYVCFDGLKASLYCKDCAKEFIETQNNKVKIDKKNNKAKGVFASVLAAALCFSLFTAVYYYIIPVENISLYNASLTIKPIMLTMLFSAILSILTFLAFRISTKQKGTKRLLPCGLISFISSLLLVYSASVSLYIKMFDLSVYQMAKVAKIIISAPITDEYIQKDFWLFLVYNALTVVAVTLIYSIIFEEKIKEKAFIVSFQGEQISTIECQSSDVDNNISEGDDNISEGDDNISDGDAFISQGDDIIKNNSHDIV